MLLIFVPAQQAQLLPAHLRDHCTLQFPTLLFEDAVAHLKNIREERCARAQLRMTERMRLSWSNARAAVGRKLPIGNFNKTTHLFHVATAQLTKTLMQCPRGEKLYNLLHRHIFTGTWILRSILSSGKPPCPLKSFLLYLDFCLHSPIYWLSSLPPSLSMELFLHGLEWQALFVAFRAGQASEGESFHLSCSPLYVVPLLRNKHAGALTWSAFHTADCTACRITCKVHQGCPWLTPGEVNPGLAGVHCFLHFLKHFPAPLVQGGSVLGNKLKGKLE